MKRIFLNFSNVFSSHRHRNSTYADMSDDELINCFKPHSWSEICKDDQRMLEVMQELGDRYADMHGIKDKPIVIKEEDERLLGGYIEGANIITVNLTEAKRNSIEVIDTIAHEENHALQYQCKREHDGSAAGYSEGELAVLKAESAEYEKEGLRYLFQSLETDSNNAGLRFTLHYKDKFINEEEFESYLQKRANVYHQIADRYAEEPDIIKQSEYGQILKAYSQKKISAEEAECARKCLVEGNSFIRVESDYLGGQVKKIQNEIARKRAQEVDDGLGFLDETCTGRNVERPQEEIEFLRMEKQEIQNEYTIE